MDGFHVTERDAAEAILKEGFIGGHGDVGFGVYFYGCLASARAYARRGGWDGRLRDPVILLATDPSIAPIEAHLLHPSWNAATYADMLWKEIDEDEQGDTPWMPSEVVMFDTGPFRKRRKRA